MKASDRRRFFRIDDRLQLSIRRAVDEDGAGGGGMRTSDVMMGIDRRIETIIAAARLQAPAVAELGELLNRKLNYVIETLELNEELSQRAAFHEYAVSLSACGMGLTIPEHYEAGEQLVLHLILPPEETRLVLLSRVIRCLEQPGGGYLLHADYSDIKADDQETLISYIMRRQSNFLQQLREGRESRPARN